MIAEALPYTPKPEFRRRGYKLDIVVPFVEQNRQSVDWARVVTADTRALFLGYPGGYRNGTIRKVSEVVTGYAAENLPALRKLGFTHLGTDLFEAFTQLLLDHYVQTGERREDLIKYLDGYCGGYYSGYVDSLDGVISKDKNRHSRPHHPVRLLDVARQVNLNPVGLGHISYDPYDDFGGTDVESDLSYERFIAQRLINTLFFTPDSRIVSVINSRHAGDREDKVAGLVKNTGFKTTSVYLSGAEGEEASSCIDTVAEEMGLADQEFILPRLPKELGPIANYDWVIHVAKQQPTWRAKVNRLQEMVGMLSESKRYEHKQRGWVRENMYFIDCDWNRDFPMNHQDYRYIRSLFPEDRQQIE